MSVKIKISYNTNEELAEVIKLLSPVCQKVKRQPAKGKYKRAYILAEPRKT